MANFSEFAVIGVNNPDKQISADQWNSLVSKLTNLSVNKTPFDFGAVGDGTTDDHAALQEWLDEGGDLFLPPFSFYSSLGLVVRKQVRIQGAGYGFDATVAGYENMPGSKIVFADDSLVSRLFDVQPQTTLTDITTVLADTAAAFTQEGAYGSTFSDFALIGPNSGTADGFYSRTLVNVSNVYCIQFGGRGFTLMGTADIPSVGDEYGNTSTSSLRDCVSFENGSHGFHIRGRDSSTILIDNCNARTNIGRGFLEEGLLGNKYHKCHAAANTGGSYKSTNAVNETVFDHCYVEGDSGSGAVINSLNKIIGGGLASVNVPTDFAPWSVGGYVTTLQQAKFNWGFDPPGAITDVCYVFRHVTHGLWLQGHGATYDFTLRNKDNEDVINVPTGGQDVNFAANITTAGYVKSATGDFRRGDGNQCFTSVAGNPTTFYSVGVGDYNFLDSSNIGNNFEIRSTGVNVLSGAGYKVGGTKVVGAQGAAVADATDAASVITQLNSLLARLRAHGLIAT